MYLSNAGLVVIELWLSIGQCVRKVKLAETLKIEALESKRGNDRNIECY